MVYELLNNGKNFFFAHDDVILAIDFHFRAGKLAEQHAVADFDIQRADFTVLALARAKIGLGRGAFKADNKNFFKRMIIKRFYL